MSLVIAAIIVYLCMAVAGVATWVSLRSSARYLVPFALLVGGGLVAIAFYLTARITADAWFAYPMVAGYGLAAGALFAMLFRAWCHWRHLAIH
jgi:hypothetical protein